MALPAAAIYRSHSGGNGRSNGAPALRGYWDKTTPRCLRSIDTFSLTTPNVLRAAWFRRSNSVRLVFKHP